MPAYHSVLTNDDTKDFKKVAGVPLIPIKTGYKTPAVRYTEKDGASDIVEEAISMFKAQVFFKTFDVKYDSDKVLLYCILYIQDTLTKLGKCQTKNDASKTLNSHALSKFAVPGESTWPLPGFYETPSRSDSDTLRQYFLCLRQEIGDRMAARVFKDDKPDKWWLCFAKRRFMNLALK